MKVSLVWLYRRRMTSRRGTKVFRYGIFIFYTDGKAMLLKTKNIVDPSYEIGGDVLVRPGDGVEALRAKLVELHGKFDINF